MEIFLAYASEDREFAEQIQLALTGSAHHVFYDKESLPAGNDYHARIHSAVQLADVFIFLISPNSVAQGSYALTELKYARAKWPHPKTRLLPVLLHATDWQTIPSYLKSVTVLEPEGNIAAEVLMAIETLVRQLPSLQKSPQPAEVQNEKQPGENTKANNQLQIWIAIISLVGALGVALISNWEKIFKEAPVPELPDKTDASSLPKSQILGTPGLTGPDTNSSAPLVLNRECPEITIMDSSKFPPESRIERRCLP